MENKFNNPPLEITVGMKLFVSGGRMKVKSIQGDSCVMVWENGCLPTCDGDRIKSLKFLSLHARPLVKK